MQLHSTKTGLPTRKNRQHKEAALYGGKVLNKVLVAIVCMGLVAGAAKEAKAAAEGASECYAAVTAKNWAKAYALCSASADQGDALAQNILGAMYTFGHGVAQDDAAAVIWHRKAADQGDAKAQNLLGVMYRNGEGVAQDYAAAVSWFRKAADQGVASAQNNLAGMYYYGEGVTQDYAAAVSWYRKAADQGDALAQNSLGAMYNDGQGVAQDYIQAHKWHNLAAAGATDATFRDSARRNRDRTVAKMQPAQIAEAQRLASDWRKK